METEVTVSKEKYEIPQVQCSMDHPFSRLGQLVGVQKCPITLRFYVDF